MGCIEHFLRGNFPKTFTLDVSEDCHCDAILIFDITDFFGAAVTPSAKNLVIFHFIKSLPDGLIKRNGMYIREKKLCIIILSDRL
jgi:hypothetical protein